MIKKINEWWNRRNDFEQFWLVCFIGAIGMCLLGLLSIILGVAK